MAQGKFFFCRSHLNGFVLEVQNSAQYPGAPLIMWHQKPDGNDNQLWYEDPGTGTIRTKMNDFCIDLQGDNLTIMPYQPGSASQAWMLAANKIQNRYNASQSFDIKNNSEDAGAEVFAWDFHGGPNQLWSFEYTAPRFFFLRSAMNGKVVDIRGGSADPGAKVIMYEQGDGYSDNQLWYEDKYGVIRSKLNDLVMDSSEGSMRMQEYEPTNPAQQWIYNGGRVTNRHDEGTCLDIKGGSSSNGAKLITYEYNGGDNQHWSMDFVE